MNKKLFFTVAFLCNFIFSFGQTLDQSNTITTTNVTLVSSASNSGQSFNCGITGQLTSVNIFKYSGAPAGIGTFNLLIRSGNGYGGAILASQSFSVVNDYTGEFPVVFSIPANIIAGSLYTIEIQWVSGQCYFGTNNSNSYINGDFFEVNVVPNYEMWFKTFVTPVPATHLNFAGSNNRVSIPNQSVSNLTNFTFEAWLKTPASSLQAIYAEGNSSNNNPMFSIIKMISGFEIVLRNSSNVGLVVSSTMGSVATNTWTHVAFVRTSATTASLYINGTNTDNFTFTDPGSINVDVTNLGVRQRVNFDGWLNGNLDEVRIWNRSLSETEIQNNMNCELLNPSTQAGLISYYQFNQGIDGADNTSVMSLLDASSSANNGTLNGFALTGSSSNWASGSPVVTGSTCATLNTNSFEVGSSIKMYPNPANSILFIEVAQLSNAKLQVLDITGKVLMNKDLNNNSNTVDINHLTAGLYLFRVTSNEGTSTNKIIKN